VSEADARPLPHPDRDSEPYWRALAEGRFELQRCSGCGALRWPPRALCNRCLEFGGEWVPVAPDGRIVSWTRTHQVFSPVFQEDVPYVTVQVALDVQDDILMIGGWVAKRTPRSGESVRMKLVEALEGYQLPCWEPA
jgi:uncharacterized OB-fold protein